MQNKQTSGLSVTSNTSLSCKARELKFCIHNSHTHAKNVTMGIFEILSAGTEIWRLFKAKQMSMANFTRIQCLLEEFQLSSFKTEGGDRGDRWTQEMGPDPARPEDTLDLQ